MKKLLPQIEKIAIMVINADWLTYEASKSAIKFPYYRFAVDGMIITEIAMTEHDIMQPVF